MLHLLAVPVIALLPGPIDRRSILLGAVAVGQPQCSGPAWTGASVPSANSGPVDSCWAGPADAALRRSSVFAVVPDGKADGKARPDLQKQASHVAVSSIVKSSSAAAGKGLALFLGEHHNDAETHVLQAALITRLRDQKRGPMAVGLEAVQRQYQPVLDAYGQGRLSTAQLRAAVEWDKRWSWPFERYVPVFEAAREAGTPLLALNVDSEDLALVQTGGFPALGARRMAKYIPDAEAFASFSSTAAFREYVEYVLRPSYNLHKQLGLLRRTRTGELLEADQSFSNFLSTRLLWDEAMGSRAAAWLSEPANRGGLVASLVGSDHVK